MHVENVRHGLAIIDIFKNTWTILLAEGGGKSDSGAML
jgi:hypothetical protein